MRLENSVWDARDPHRLGRFWSAALGAELITDEPGLIEARLRITDDAFRGRFPPTPRTTTSV